MTDLEIRELIADALAYAAAFKFRRSGVKEAFIAGEADMTFDELELDSLAAMELCIAIEANAGVSILPEGLPELGSLDGLVAAIREAR